jgi:antitoxin CptB
MNQHRARLAWRCRRGNRELDLLLAAYLEHRYEEAPDAERDLFALLVSRPDSHLQSLLFKPLPVSERHLAPLIDHILACTPIAG